MDWVASLHGRDSYTTYAIIFDIPNACGLTTEEESVFDLYEQTSQHVESVNFAPSFKANAVLHLTLIYNIKTCAYLKYSLQLSLSFVKL